MRSPWFGSAQEKDQLFNRCFTRKIDKETWDWYTGPRLKRSGFEYRRG